MSVRIRPARPDDAEAVAAIYAPIVRDTPISFEIEPPDADEMRQRFASSRGRTPWLVCTEADALLGYAYAAPHRLRPAYRWSVDVSVYVHENARSRGVGAGLYAALLPILRIQGFHRAYAGITLPNAASVGLHESAGFAALGVYRRVGFKCNVWHDVGWWDCALAEPSQPPAEPLRFEEVAGSAPVTVALAEAAARIRARS